MLCPSFQWELDSPKCINAWNSRFFSLCHALRLLLVLLRTGGLSLFSFLIFCSLRQFFVYTFISLGVSSVAISWQALWRQGAPPAIDSSGYWNTTTETFIGGILGFTVPRSVKTHRNIKNTGATNVQENTHKLKMSRNPLTPTSYLKVMKKIIIMASIRDINQANVQFRVNKPSNYTMEHMYDKVRYINSKGKHFC